MRHSCLIVNQLAGCIELQQSSKFFHASRRQMDAKLVMLDLTFVFRSHALKVR